MQWTQTLGDSEELVVLQSMGSQRVGQDLATVHFVHFGRELGPSTLLHTLFFGGSKIAADGDCSHEIKRCLLLGRKL